MIRLDNLEASLYPRVHRLARFWMAANLLIYKELGFLPARWFDQMPAVGRFLELLEAVSRRDWSDVTGVVRAVADEERERKHFGAAHKLLQALEVATSDADYERVGTLAFTDSAQSPPPLEFLHRLDSTGIEPLILPPDRDQALRELIVEWQSEARLRQAGLRPRNTVLMFGPPGCGKTHLARYLAMTLSMPLYLVRFDSLVSSYLGETASNLQQVFAFLGANRCVVLIDEIDAIAKLRDDRNELGELKRVVISLLQNIDHTETRSLLIAATNHPHLLDPALWRRFEIAWEIPLPSEQMRERIFANSAPANLSSRVKLLFVEHTQGFSGADLVQVCVDSRRKLALDAALSPDEALLLSLLDRLRENRTTSTESEKPVSDKRLTSLALALRQSGKGSKQQYSFMRLETLTGIPHSTLHHHAKAEHPA